MRAKILLLLVCVGLTGCETVGSVFHRTPSTFIVFFPVNSAQMGADAATIVHHAAEAINRVHPETVIIAAGVSAGGNMEMSQPRFAAVRQALIDDGVDQDLIARSAIADPKLDTMPARQRVEIRLVMKGN